MKQHVLGTTTEKWDDELIWEIDNGVFRINGHNQSGVIHYQQKHLAKEFGKYYA